MANITFGGFISAGGPSSKSKMIRGPAGPMQLVSTSAQAHHSLSIAGMAGYYHDDHAVDTFMADLATAVKETPAASRKAHARVWDDFWAGADITITAAAAPANPSIAAQAERVTLMDKVTRAAIHSQSFGNISGIHSQAYGIWSAYPAPQEDYRIWGPCQWFQNMRLPYYHMLADGRFESMKSLFNFCAYEYFSSWLPCFVW